MINFNILRGSKIRTNSDFVSPCNHSDKSVLYLLVR